MNETAKKMIINNLVQKVLVEKIPVYESLTLAFEKGYECGKDE